MSQPQNIINQDTPICKLLISRGIDPTQARIEVARVVLDKIQHLTFGQIRSRLQGCEALIADEAIISILQLFRQQKLLREVYVDATTVFYDSNSCVHPHMYNANTGELIDILARHVDIYDTAQNTVSTV